MLNESEIRLKAEADGVTHFTTGIAVFRNGKLLVARRSGDDEDLAGEWELPGGGMDAGETVLDGAVRELFEETGLKVSKVISTFEGFDYTTPKKPKARQFNFRVLVKPGNIQLSEHDAYQWITVDDVPSLKTNKVMEDCLFDAFNISN